eukprot:TRINITY_DN14319_c0_g2_i1.p1 TRINITY_DN14319_c0_g2~~TRINITY_DN14319_c0_g2_i1.p1  ORF type:complete len:397 (-),score=60.33 TRINITY_DN14319_c0_g2_i1:102-1292(-)
MKVFVVHWGDLNLRLPIGNDLASQARRRALFESIDGSDGKGILFQGKVIRAIYRSLPTITGMPDTRPFLTRAFHTVVTTIPPVAPIGTDNCDRNQFRVFMIYIIYYLKIWEVLCQHPLETKGHVSFSEFEALLVHLRDWGFAEARVWEGDPHAWFDRLSSHLGIVPTEEFLDRLLRGALLDLAKEGEDTERQLAERLLKRTHPHMVMSSGSRAQGITFAGSAPPVPPPGQKRPPPVPEAEEFRPGNFQRWSTQYMCDFECPSRLQSQAPSRLGSLAPSRSAYSQARTRVGTVSNSPRGDRGRPLMSAKAQFASQAASMKSPSGMRHSHSMPEAGTTFSGLDREELRQKLEKHLEMSTTMDMRKILRVAGGMVTAKPNQSPFAPPSGAALSSFSRKV